MTMWLDAEGPWAAQQTVGVAISSSEASQTSCSAWQQRGIDAVLPEGELKCITPSGKCRFTRGIKAVELGRLSDNRPQANVSPRQRRVGGVGCLERPHLPDNSTARNHPLDEAMTCIGEFGGVASGAVTALENDDSFGERSTSRTEVRPNGTYPGWIRTPPPAGSSLPCPEAREH